MLWLKINVTNTLQIPLEYSLKIHVANLLRITLKYLLKKLMDPLKILFIQAKK
jgi:hypothetical protein